MVGHDTCCRLEELISLKQVKCFASLGSIFSQKYKPRNIFDTFVILLRLGKHNCSF